MTTAKSKPKPKAKAKSAPKRKAAARPRAPSQQAAYNSKLPDKVRAFIVMSYARFALTRDIHKAVLDEFGLDLDSKMLCNHMLDRPSRAAEMGARWVAMFNEARAEFCAQVDAIPITNPAYRLAKMQRYFDILDAKDAIGPAMSVLEQAAKEAGGAFTNKRELSGKLKVEDAEPRDTMEQRAVLVAAIEEALLQLKPQAQTSAPQVTTH